MKTNFEETVKEMTEFLANEAKTETIIGKDFKLGEFNCVPVMTIGMGLGAGEGIGGIPKGGEGEGGLGGVGLGMSPIGFLVSRNDQIQFVSAKGQSGLSNAVEKLPDLLSKYFESRKGNHAPTA